jgi:hypothetical protein
MILPVCVWAGEAWDEWDEEKGFIPVIHWSAESALGTNRIEEMHRKRRPLLTNVPFWLFIKLDMEVTNRILAKICRFCQLSSHSRSL